MPKQLCPLIREVCSEHQCAWYVHLVGQNPQTGDPVDTWGCTVSVLPMLLIETSKNARETAVKVDSFRELATQVVKSNALRVPTPELKRMIGIQES
jgi:hypothetical protein